MVASMNGKAVTYARSKYQSGAEKVWLLQSWTWEFENIENICSSLYNVWMDKMSSPEIR